MSGTNTIVIFGASGDLTRRKLVPSLFSLYCKGRLPEDWRIIGMSRTKMSDEEFRQELQSGIHEFTPNKIDDLHWAAFKNNVYYQPGNLSSTDDMLALKKRLEEIEQANDGAANRVYYLAIAPRLYKMTVDCLGQVGLTEEKNGWRRVVIEKPFGHDLASAKELNQAVHRVLNENQVFRIDHYLGKETVQNLLVFRFANSLFEPVWNRNYIDHVQITAAETVDIGHRADYYDGVGVMRDMVQNHMLQLLALVAIEPPSSFDADALRNEKVKLMKAIRPIRAEEVAQHTVRGRYEGYNQTKGVDPDSKTATYTALRLYVDNWRWQGVPFFLRSGKALAAKTTQISIYFKRPPHLMFPLPENTVIEANDLSICIQPHEGIHFSFQAKVPDTNADMRTVDMSFQYEDFFGAMSIPDAYERLLLDVLKGDASLFTRGDAHELAWHLIDNILAGWELDTAPPLEIYERGSWGPPSANGLIWQHGCYWALGCQER